MAKGNNREHGAGRSGKGAFLEEAVTGGSTNKNLGSRVRGDSLEDINAKLIAEEERKRKEAAERTLDTEASETTTNPVDQRALEQELQEALAAVAPADTKEGSMEKKPRYRVKASSTPGANTGEPVLVEKPTPAQENVPEIAQEKPVEDFKDYDALIGDVAKRPLPTDREPKSIPENIQAYEGTMRALIPKIGATAGFYAMLERSEDETRKVRALEATFKKAKSEHKDSVEFELNGKKETSTIEHVDQYIREAKTKLQVTRADLEHRADQLLSDKKILETAEKLRAKTTEHAETVLSKRLAEATTDEERDAIRKDSDILIGALNHVHTFKPNGGLTSFGAQRRARFANTNSATNEILKKYNIKPATEDDIKPPKAPRAPKIEPPKPEVTTPAPETTITKPSAKRIVVPEGQPYQRISEPTTEADGKQYVRVAYPDGSQGAVLLSEYLPHEGDKPFITAPVEPVSVTAPKEVPKPKAVRAERKKKVVMTAGDLGLPGEEASKLTEKEIPVGVGLEGKGIVKRERNKKIEIDQDPALMGVGLEGDGIIEKTPVGVGLEGDGITSPKRVIETLVASPEDALALSPEQQARIEAHRSAVAEQAARITADAEKAGLVDRLRQLSDRYRNMHWSKKLAIGAGFAGITAIGLTGIAAGGWLGATIAGVGWAGGRTLAALGTWGMLDQATSKMKNRYLAGAISVGGGLLMAFGAPRLAQWIDAQTGFGHWVAERFGITPPSTGPSNTSPAPISVATTEPSPVVPQEPAPNAPSVTIKSGDTIWGVVEKGLNQRPEFSGLDRAGKDLAIDTYMKKMGGMTPDQLKALGISSGDINKIQIGEQIKLPVLQDQALFEKAVTDAKGLTVEQKENILKYRAGVGQGTAAYVPPAPEATPAVAVNVTANYQGTLESIFGNRQSNYRNFISWRNPDYIINQANFTPEGLSQETNTDPVTLNKLRDTLVQLKKAGFTGRTVEQLLQAGARGKAGL